MCAATRKKGTSIRRWNWRSTMKPTASVLRLTPSTAFPHFSALARMPRRHSVTRKSPAAGTHTNMASTPRTLRGGDGPINNEGVPDERRNRDARRVSTFSDRVDQHQYDPHPRHGCSPGGELRSSRNPHGDGAGGL